MSRVNANLRIWRNLNQDGISQANEMTALSANSITSIGVNSSAVRMLGVTDAWGQIRMLGVMLGVTSMLGVMLGVRS